MKEADEEGAELRGADRQVPLRKSRNVKVWAQFVLVEESGSAGERQIITCRHCTRVVQRAAKFNVSRGLTHLLTQCRECPECVKHECLVAASARTRAMRGLKRTRHLSSPSSVDSDGYMTGSSTISSIDCANSSTAGDHPVNGRSMLRPAKRRQTTMTEFVQPINGDEAQRIVKQLVTSMLARFEPISRLEDPVVLRTLSVMRPGLEQYVPSHSTILSQVIPQIDSECTAALDDMFAKLPGQSSLAIDGVTVLHSSHLLITEMKGQVTRFCDMLQLKDRVHVTADEAKAVCDVVRARLQQQAIDGNAGYGFATIAVDNAGTAVAAKLRDMLHSEFGAHNLSHKTLVTRDPAHCIDLLPKSLVEKVPGLRVLVAGVTNLLSLLRVDRIDGIRRLMLDRGELGQHHVPPAQLHCQTRMHRVHDMLECVLRQKPFLDILEDTPEYAAYRDSRDPDTRNKLDQYIGLGKSLSFRQRVAAAKLLLSPCCRALKIVSSNTTPMSSYLLIVTALFNEICAALDSDSWKSAFDQRNTTAVRNALQPRFNLDGQETGHRCVGLMDEYQLLSFQVDPYNAVFCGDHSDYVQMSRVDTKKAIVAFGEHRTAGECPVSERMIQATTELKLECDRFFGKTTPAFRTEYLSVIDIVGGVQDYHNNKALLTLDHVSDHLTKTGGHDSRLSWWESNFPQSILYRHAARQLLSIRTTGSITVERVAKRLKHAVLTKTRNRLSTMSAAMLLRAGMNIRFLLAEAE